MNISLCTVSLFLNRSNFQPPVNMGEIDYHMDEMQKITRKKLGLEDKMRNFWWIASLISLNGKDIVWVVGGPGLVSQKIEKHTLNVKGKKWWMLVCPTTGDNVLSLVRTALITGFMDRYEFDVGEFLT